MGKRGPHPKGEYGGKIARTAVLSTRLQPDTRARLSEAAKASGRSLSQELEHRLRGSFIEEDKVVDFYGCEFERCYPQGDWNRDPVDMYELAREDYRRLGS